MTKLRPSKFFIYTLLTLFLCLSVVIAIPSNDFVESRINITTKTAPSMDVSEKFNLADLIEVEYMGINGNDELLQMAEDNNWPGAGFEWDPIIISGYLLMR